MKNTLHYDKRQADFHRFVNDNFESLQRLRLENKGKAFNELLLTLLPDIKRYITRGLRIALSKGVISHNKYKPDDLFDQLIIDVWDNLDEVHDKDAFHAWLFKRAEKLLEDMEVEEEFTSYFYDNIADYSRAERDQMLEEFSTDGDGDLVMLEELDDISYKNHQYLLKNIFLDDSHEDLMALLERSDDKEEPSRLMESALFKLPPNMRSVFELATEQLFTLEDISLIKGFPIEHIEKMLERARELLQTTLKDEF
ncbi:RNA polymerase sigma factor [Robiginitalea aurantiaca]|uniref:Sigma-70 family RNA polymerase sigma factor n=1 Tax=Robiginitalea aurantiaca TaxID=3056915 RepID=A0ABT7WH81_9FLAO|nr:sigma-70 family RNA polymerase sigma factor [Robiginitalea aurantiaca]MDM9632278.1 sigma-70 family RNA polymerase sigma factor [Robiginitalea aurantiaca]